MTRMLIAGGLALIALAGCSAPLDAPTQPGVDVITAAPGAPPVGGFFPLTAGNYWRYARESRIWVVPADGSEPFLIAENTSSEREIICVDPRGGVDYYATRVTEVWPGGSRVWWIRSRQSAAGLFVLGADSDVPPPCALPDEPAHATASRPTRSDALETFLAARPDAERAAYRRALASLDERRAMVHAVIDPTPVAFLPGAARPGEGTLLRYPLTPKRSWLVYAGLGFRIAAQVEGFDLLVLPPGPLECYRIRHIVPGFGPDDRAHLWYGPAGYLQSETHFTATAHDHEGRPYGRIISDERERLVQMSRQGP